VADRDGSAKGRTSVAFGAGPNSLRREAQSFRRLNRGNVACRGTRSNTDHTIKGDRAIDQGSRQLDVYATSAKVH
jgi:hypothetical protein